MSFVNTTVDGLSYPVLVYDPEGTDRPRNRTTFVSGDKNLARAVVKELCFLKRALTHEETKFCRTALELSAHDFAERLSKTAEFGIAGEAVLTLENPSSRRPPWWDKIVRKTAITIIIEELIYPANPFPHSVELPTFVRC